MRHRASTIAFHRTLFIISLQLFDYCSPPGLLWSSLLSFPLRVPFHGYSSSVLLLFPQGMAYPFPLPSFYRDCYIFLSNCYPQVFVCDNIWPEDTSYLAESLVDKRLYFGKQSFCWSPGFGSVRSPDLTLELNILIFVLRLRDVAFQTALRHAKAC